MEPTFDFQPPSPSPSPSPPFPSSCFSHSLTHPLLCSAVYHAPRLCFPSFLASLFSSFLLLRFTFLLLLLLSCLQSASVLCRCRHCDFTPTPA